MIHYIYRIDFLQGEAGRYYLGKRTFRWKNIENDSYAGSGDFCKEYYKKYGKVKDVTYKKTIIEINKDLETNRQREEIIIGDLWRTDPLCMNKCPGGYYSSYAIKKKVVQYDLEGNIIAEYNSISDAEETTGVCGSSISKCCLGNPRRKIIGGFIWRYKGDAFDKYVVPKRQHLQLSGCKKINQYEINGTFIKMWDCLDDILENFGKTNNRVSIMDCLKHKKKYKTAYGYRWEFYNGNTDNLKPLDSKFKYPVAQYDLNGVFIKRYDACSRAALEIIGNRHGEKIKQCAEGKIPSAHGYIWKFVE